MLPEEPPIIPSLQNRIPSLDGLRAISITMVVGFHLFNSEWRLKTGRDYDGLWSILFNGGTGVSVFFVISGFLITSLLLNEIRKTGRIHLTDFYVRRSFRIWPALYFYLGTIAVLHLLKIVGINMQRDWLSAALFVFNYVPRAGNPWVGHTWSLAVEEQFYILWPLTLMLLARRRSTIAAVILVLAVPVVRFVEARFFPQSIWTDRMWETAHTRIDTLMVGCIVALLWDSARFQAVLGGMFRLKLQIVSLIALFAVWPVLDHIASGSLSSALGYSIENICIAILMVWLIQNSKTLTGRVLNSPIFVHVGVISYSLYLWNQIFCTPVNKTWSGRFPANIVCAIVMAEFSRYFIEVPFLKLRAVLPLISAKPRLAVAPAVTALPTRTPVDEINNA
jgi:peptidoglycan/LPS O-acetylase OafA/YrhL